MFRQFSSRLALVVAASALTALTACSDPLVSTAAGGNVTLGLLEGERQARGEQREEAERQEGERQEGDDAGRPTDDAPAREDDAPAREDDAPAREDDAPAREDDAPAREDDAPAREDDAPAREDDAPVRERAREVAPTGPQELGVLWLILLVDNS